jgi:uncharacterized membrane protein YebE (DUF533 family)
MDTSFLLSTVLNGVLGARRKQSHRARHYLNGGLGGLLSNPAALMTAAGLAWGVYETLQQQKQTPTGASTPPTVPPPLTTTASNSVPPVGGAAPAVPPADMSARQPLSESVTRLVRLAISAANADGAMNDRERAAITRQATAAGVPDVALADLNQPRPLAEIVAGVATAEDAATLYVLAYTILRADEQVTAVERIYLAQLAHLLHLDEATVQALEKTTGERIDALGDQGQLGG